MYSKLLMTSALALTLSAGAYAQEQQSGPKAEGEIPPAVDTANQDQQPAADAPATEDMAAQPEADGRWLTTQDEQEYRAADIIGVNVMNSEGEEIGKVDDLVLDSEGKVVGVLLSVGGFLGIGGKRVGVPIDQIEFDREAQTAMADFSSEVLENAPSFMTLEELEAEAEAAAAQQQMNEQPGMPSPGVAPEPAVQ